MIGTVTANPAVDVRYTVSGFAAGSVHRVNSVHKTAGGKGLNVSRVATLLGEKVKATGFLGGYTGAFIRQQIRKLGIIDDFIETEGETRTCLAVLSHGGEQTELLEPGPIIAEQQLLCFYQAYENMLSECKVIAASGSLPQGLPHSFYADLIEKANQRGVKFLLDTSGQSLARAIEAKPYFIKPNTDELAALTGKSVHTETELVGIMDSLHDRGIQLVVISRGKDGSVASYNGQKFKVTLPQVQAVNPVGSGDSFVAGVALAISRGYGIRELLAFASSCGTANAMEEMTGFVRPEVVARIQAEVRVESMSWG